MRNLSNLYIDGVVGIGTTSTSYKLSVVGTSHSWNVNPHANGIDLYSTGNVAPHYQTTFDWYTGAPGSGSFKMRLDSTGNLGIGTTTPAQKLHVLGSARVTGDFQLTGANPRIDFNFSGSDALRFYDSANATERMRITSGGSLLIGTTTQSYNPQTQGYLLGVKSNASQAFISIAKSGQTLDDQGMIVGLDTTTGYVWMRQSVALTLGTNNTPRVTITSTGNVGIGTTAPNSWAQLETTGTVAVGGILYLKSSGKIQGLSGFPGSASTLSINPDGGNVGIGTTTPAHKLDVAGGVAADYLQLDTTATPTPAQGMIYWDADEETAAVQVNGFNYELGQGLYWVAKNQTGSQINKGTAVYASGTLGASGRLLISPMIANGSIEAKYFLGITAEDIADGDDGKVITQGKIRQIDTSGYGAAGNVLWVSATTAGALTQTKPTGSNLALAVAFVVDFASNGTLATRVSTLDENTIGVIPTLDQVTTAGNTTTNDITVGNIQVNGNYIKFDEGTNAESRIVSSANYLEIIGNGPLAASGARMWLGKGGSVDSGYYVNGSQLFFRGLDSSTKMYINGTSGNVGIGTTAPDLKLHISHNDSNNGLLLQDSNNVNNYQILLNIRKNEGLIFQRWISGAFNTNLATLDYNGNIGIGTTSPAQKLDVAGGDIILSSNATYIRSKDASGNTPRMFGINPSNDTYIGPIDPYAGGAVFYGVSANVSSQTFYTGASSRLHINSAGNIGIGTTSPDSKLNIISGAKGIHIDKGSYSSTAANLSECRTIYAFAYDTLRNGSTTGFFITNVSTNVPAMQAVDSSNNAQNISIQPFGGNVGIGTTAPSGKLDVRGGKTYLSPLGNSGSGIDSHALVLRNLNDTPFTANALTAYNAHTSWDIENYSTFTASPRVNDASVYTYAGENASASVAVTRFVQFNSANTSPLLDWTFFQWDGAGTSALDLKKPSKLWTVKTYENAGTVEKMSLSGDGDMYLAGNVGIGIASPSTKLDVNGVITATGGNSTQWNTAYSWGDHSTQSYATQSYVTTAISNLVDSAPSTLDTLNELAAALGDDPNFATTVTNSIASKVPQTRTLTINGTAYDLSADRSWTIATTTPGGSNTQFQYNSSGTLAGASALTYNSVNNRIGVNQASPGYDFDVNGQVRVQDKLRVGTVNSGNGVVHMSSSATINPNTTTIVWAQNVSVGMCAFIEYYILNNNSLTDQRAGTIIVTWNQSGTPTIAHTETTTPDIGSTTAVNFTSSLVGSDARINAVNSSANPYTIVMSYKYF